MAIEKYQGQLLRQYPHPQNGIAANGVSVSVYLGKTGTTPATIYSSSSGGFLANPVATGTDGKYSFYAEEGFYRLVFGNGTEPLIIELFNGQNLSLANAQFKNEQQAAYDAFVISQGWTQVGTFEAGFTFTSPNQVGQDADGNWWRWNGALPKTVTAGTPTSSDANYKLVGDGVLRSELAASGSTVLIAGVEAVELVERVDDCVGVGRNFMQQVKLQNRSVNLYFLGDSTSGPSYPWVLALAGDLADLFPTHSVNYRLFLDDTDDYGSNTAVSAGTGSHSINVFNASVPGATATYFNSFRRENLWVNAPDLVIFNYGHNFASDATTDQLFAFMYPALLDIMGDYPLAEYALTIQNVDTSLVQYTGRQAAVVQNIASLCNIGVIDFRTPFVNAYYAGNIGPLMFDSVHPSPAGEDLMRETFLRSLRASKKISCTPINPLKELTPNLLYNEHFFAWPFASALPYGYTVNSFCTGSKDFNEFETLGYSLKLTNASASLGLMSTDQSTILSQITKGQGLTFAARVKTLDDAGNNAGRVEIGLGTATVSSVTQTQGRGAWMWVAAYATPAQLEAATRLAFSVYAGNDSDVTYVDRLSICTGKVLTDSQFKFLPLTEFYNTTNVIPKTANDVLVVSPDGTIQVTNTVDLYPGIGINLLYLEIGKSYTATWVTSVAGASSGAYIRDFGLQGAFREFETPLGTDVSGDLVGSLTFVATQTTASMQMEIISSSGGTTFTISNLTIVQSA